MLSLVDDACEVQLTPDLIRRHQAGVWRYLRFLGCEASLAEDLTQDAFVALLRQPPRSVDPEVVGAWLRRTATNLFRNTGRRPRGGLPLDAAEIEAAWTTFVRAEDGEDAMSALRECMDVLPERMAAALQLRYGHDGSRRVVAEVLGLASDGAKTLLRRARERLQRCMEHKLQGTQKESR